MRSNVEVKMRIHFDNVNLSARSGPNTFGRRLARGLFESGHEVVDSGPEADISLVFIEPSGAPLARKVVQRLDGIWFKPSEFHIKNAQIKSLYERADYVVWQSHFDRKMTTKWWGDRNGKVIHNGTQSQPVLNFTSQELADLRQRYRLFLVCSANWHPQKRLKANIDMFKHIRATIEPNTCLVVMGADPQPLVADPNIFYTGSLPEELCLEIFSSADWMLHLAWLDHCPNTVVEALSQGTPVICSSSGGTRELVDKFGIIIQESQEYEYTLEDYDNPPQIDVTTLKNLDKALISKNGVTHCDISMTRVLRDYLSVFDEVTT